MIWIISVVLLVQSLAWHSGPRIQHCHNCGVGCRCGRKCVVLLVQSLARELSYVLGVAPPHPPKKDRFMIILCHGDKESYMVSFKSILCLLQKATRLLGTEWTPLKYDSM